MTEGLQTGTQLGRYELLVPLAQGATAQVWAARMTGSRLEKIVAVKGLLSAIAAALIGTGLAWLYSALAVESAWATEPIAALPAQEGALS